MKKKSQTKVERKKEIINYLINVWGQGGWYEIAVNKLTDLPHSRTSTQQRCVNLVEYVHVVDVGCDVHYVTC